MTTSYISSMLSTAIGKPFASLCIARNTAPFVSEKTSRLSTRSLQFSILGTPVPVFRVSGALNFWKVVLAMAGASPALLVAAPLARLSEVSKQNLRIDLTSRSCYRPRHSKRASVAITRCGKHVGSVLEEFSSPKRGVVGTERFKDAALPGTYWGPSVEAGANVAVEFNRGSECVVVMSKAGENFLKLAERCGVMIPNNDFCFEGSCCHCEMEVIGGAREVGYRANTGGDELIRSCICPVPEGKTNIKVNLINEEDVWGEGVV